MYVRHFRVNSDPLIVVKMTVMLKKTKQRPPKKPTNGFLTQSIYMESFKILSVPPAMCHMSNLDQEGFFLEILLWFLEISWGSLYLFLCYAAVVRMQ